MNNDNAVSQINLFSVHIFQRNFLSDSRPWIIKLIS